MKSASTLVRMLDQPAQSAVDLAGEKNSSIFEVFIVGFLATAASTFTSALLVRHSWFGALQGLRYAFESGVAVIPTALVVIVFLGVKISPRVLVSTLSLGWLNGGLISLSLVPFFGFLILVTEGNVPRALVPAVGLPAICMVAIMTLFFRVFRIFDDSDRGRLWASFFVAFMALTYLVRVIPFIRTL